MAKTTNCSFCNKELKKGFFSEEVCSLEVTDFRSIVCCGACHKKYRKVADNHKSRFNLKYETIKKTTRKKISEQELTHMFITYINEYVEARDKQNGLDIHFGPFFNYKDDGSFAVREFGKGLINEDVDVYQKAMSNVITNLTDTLFFTKDDITKIEYAKSGMGSFAGLFKKAYSFNIRLNDERVMTYKPAITRSAHLGSGFMFGYQKSAEKKLKKELELFKALIGSDLPIVKVRSI